MKIKAAALILGLLFATQFSRAETFSFSSAPFQSVDYLGGLNSSIVFDSVIIKRSIWKVAALADSVEIILAEENKNVYTTINVINAEKDYGSIGWLKAERVIVCVRQKNDLLIWQKFLSSVKKKQELERKKWAEPTRVFPPQVSPP